MKTLVRLYPRSWRERYGSELELLLDQIPSDAGVAIDLAIGAAIAYRDVMRANRFLSAAGAYLHGVSVAVLLQAIAFVSLVLYSQTADGNADVAIGPVHLASLTVQQRGIFLDESAVSLKRWLAGEWLIAILMLGVLLVTLTMVIATPRLLRSLR